MRTVVNPRAIPEPAIDRYGRGAPPITKSIPFDYVFEFKLQGKSANDTQNVVKLQDVVEISMQGVFVGVSIGYSFVLDERKNPRAFGAVLDPATVPGDPVLIPLFQASGPLFTASTDAASATPPTLAQLQGAFVAGVPGAEVVIVDISGATVSEPLRVGVDGTVIFATPDPLGVIRVWDSTNNLLSEPIDVVVNSSTPVIGPDASTRKLPVAGEKAVTVYGGPGDTVNLFFLERPNRLVQVDGNHSLNLEPVDGGTTGRATIPLKVSNNDRPLSAGDNLLVELASTSASPAPGITSSTFRVTQITPSTLTLGAIARGLQASNVSVSSGFRLSQRFANFFAANTPFDQIDPTILGSAFEPACGPEEISFLYSIDVVSTGRELQNKPIHNIAGLGIANGDRPFRPFARPVAFEPRSVIRIQLEELSTLPGTLYIVLQGYKLLGTGRTPE
jgi:hypothetical protein